MEGTPTIKLQASNCIPLEIFLSREMGVGGQIFCVLCVFTYFIYIFWRGHNNGFQPPEKSSLQNEPLQGALSL